MASKKVLIEIGVIDKNVSPSLSKAKKGVDELANSTGRLRKANKDNRAQSGLNNAILIESGRVASDAAYGIQGVANNIGRIIELGQEFARTNKGGMGAALKDLKSSFFGVGGVLIGVQLLLSFLPRIMKSFKKAASATSEFNKKMAEASASVEGQNQNIRSLQSALNDVTLSYSQKQTILEKLRKEQGLHNATLDSSEKLNKESNEIIEKSIKLNILQAKARAAQSIIDERTKTTLQEIAKVREKENTGLNKFMTLVATVFEPVTTVINMTIDAFRGAVANLEFFLRSMSALPVVGGQFQALADIVSAYGKAVNSQEQEEKRANKTREKVAELNRKLAESTSLATQELDKVNKEIAKLEATLPSLEKETDGMSAAMERSVKRIKAFGQAIRDGIKDVTSFRTKFFDLNQQKVFQDMTLESQEQFYIKLIERSTALEAQKAMAIGEVKEYYARLSLDKAERDEMRALEILADGAKSMAELLGEQTEVGKAFAVSGALIDTYAGATKAFNDETIPSTALRFVAAASVIASGLANVRNILAVDEKGQNSISGSRGLGRSGGGIQAPEFNVVGASATNQLAMAVGESGLGQPIRAYVVGKDITNQQEFDNNQTNIAGTGGGRRTGN